MKIGGLYKVKDWEWVVYSSMEEAEKVGVPFSPLASKKPNLDWIKQTYSADVSYLEEMFVPLELQGKYLKILQTSGEFGWIVVGGSFGIRAEHFIQIT